MSGDSMKKVAKLSNPVGHAMYAYEKVTGKNVDPKIKYKGAETSLTGNTLMDAYSAASVQDAGRTMEKDKAKAEKDLQEGISQDAAAFDKFKAQENDLLSGGSSELFVPQYKVGKKQSETDALAKIFQARKDQALKQSQRPGVSQTRMGAL